MSRRRSVNVKVTLREAKGDPFRMIRRFMKKVKKERIIEEYRERMFYEKPSSVKRREKIKKKQNAKKAERDRNIAMNNRDNRRK